MTSFETWKPAHEYAQAQADKLKISFGIEKLGGQFRVFMLPKPENRTGHELRCEVVDPMTVNPVTK